MPDNMDEAKAREFAELIRREWRAILYCIIAVGNLLIEAKRSVPHKQWLSLIKGGLPFGPRTAQRLMKIAMDKRITDATRAPHLPSCWATLYELTKLSDEWFQKGLELKRIHPEMQRADAVDWVRLSRCYDSDSDNDDAEPIDRLDIPNPLKDARKTYFAECKKLSAQGHTKELKLYIDTFIPTRGEQLLQKMARREAAEEQELMLAESFNAMLEARHPSDAGDPA
jgi:hypothetical protein